MCVVDTKGPEVGSCHTLFGHYDLHAILSPSNAQTYAPTLLFTFFYSESPHEQAGRLVGGLQNASSLVIDRQEQGRTSSALFARFGIVRVFCRECSVDEFFV